LLFKNNDDDLFLMTVCQKTRKVLMGGYVAQFLALRILGVIILSLSPYRNEYTKINNMFCLLKGKMRITHSRKNCHRRHR